MIKNKKDFLYYLDRDRIALYKKYKRPRLLGDEIFKFEILLRRFEYYKNTHKPIRLFITRILFHHYSVKLGFSIPPNVFGPGLSIAHIGTIVVNSSAIVGENCRIQECTNIGSTNGFRDSPVIGDNCFIGTGAKLIGKIRVANNVAIGANAVVVKDISTPSSTWGGVPARMISNNDSLSNLNPALFVSVRKADR